MWQHIRSVWTMHIVSHTGLHCNQAQRSKTPHLQSLTRETMVHKTANTDPGAWLYRYRLAVSGVADFKGHSLMSGFSTQFNARSNRVTSIKSTYRKQKRHYEERSWKLNDPPLHLSSCLPLEVWDHLPQLSTATYASRQAWHTLQ